MLLVVLLVVGIGRRILKKVGAVAGVDGRFHYENWSEWTS